jgi:hypothetical protein
MCASEVSWIVKPPLASAGRALRQASIRRQKASIESGSLSCRLTDIRRCSIATGGQGGQRLVLMRRQVRKDHASLSLLGRPAARFPGL